MRKINTVRMALAVFAAAALITAPGCRKVFDHAAYVKALLDASYKAEFSEYIVFAGWTEEEARSQYEDNLDFFVDEICLSLQVNISVSRRDKIKAVMEKILSAASYEVIGLEKIDRNKYEVEIKTYPVTNFKDFEQPLSNFSAEFIESMKTDDMKKLTPEEVNEFYVDGLIRIFEERTQTISYGGEKTIKAPVEYVSDRKRWYIPPEEQGKIFDTMIEF